MRELTPSATRTRISWLRLLVLGCVIGVLASIAPALWMAVRAGAGLLVLGALLLVGWAGVQALPYFGQWLEKRLLTLRLADARDNPLEELLSELVQRAAQLEHYRSALAAIAAQIEGMRDMLDERRKVDPRHDTAKQSAALQKMVTFHAHHLKNAAAAEVALANYKRHLAAKRFEWNFAQAGQRVLENLRASDRESIIRELLSDEATRSVQLSFNRVFATLDLELQAVQSVELRELGSLASLPSLGGELS